MKNAKTRWMIVLGLLLALFVWANLNDGFFQYHSHCSRCGMTQHTKNLFWVPIRNTEETETSRFYDGKFSGEPHEHEWIFAHGHGPGIACAIGSGRHMEINNSRAIASLSTIQETNNRAITGKWLARLLDPETSRDVASLLHHNTDIVALRHNWDFIMDKKRANKAMHSAPPAADADPGVGDR